MCVASMVGDHYRDKWTLPNTSGWPYPGQTVPAEPVSRWEFDTLKREVQEMIALLKRAQKYDADNNEPHCENDSKMDFLRMVAKSVGVDLDKAMGDKPIKSSPNPPEPTTVNKGGVPH